MKNWKKDLAERALWTFAEAFLAAFVIDVSSITGGVQVWKAVFVSALAAGLSAAKTAILTTLKERKGNDDTET
jgi:hypothetical protein